MFTDLSVLVGMYVYRSTHCSGLECYPIRPRTHTRRTYRTMAKRVRILTPDSYEDYITI